MLPIRSALLLEDDDFDAAIIRELLEKCSSQAISVERCRVLKDATAKLTRQDFGVVLADMTVPDSAGLDTVQAIVRANPDVPIVVLSGDEDLDMAVAALKLGAQDFLPKSHLNNRTLERTVACAMQRKENETKSEKRPNSGHPVGLANRQTLYERWIRCSARAKKNGSKVGVIVANIDSLSGLYDRFGPAAADEVLQHFSEVMLSQVDVTDVAARLGGGEFVAVLEDVNEKSDVDEMQKKLTAASNEKVVFEDRNIEYSVRLGGVVTDPETNEELMAALVRADQEML